MKTNTDVDKVLELLHSISPDFANNVEALDKYGDSIRELGRELKRFNAEYPLLSTLIVDSFDIIRAHEEKLEIVKQLLMSIAPLADGEDEKPPPKDDYWVN